MQTREVIPFPQAMDLNLALPGSKSITNRALLCAALARGKSRLYGVLKSEDTAAMIKGLRVLGIRIKEKKSFMEVAGTDGRFKKGPLVLHTGNSGIATRFLTALACLRQEPTLITAGEQMSRRPMGDLIEALENLGAAIVYKGKKGCVPLRITPPARRSSAIEINGEKSSQYLSGLLLAAPLFHRSFKIKVKGNLVSKPYANMTLAVMKAFGVRVKNNGYRDFMVRPQAYRSIPYQIEGDATAATYFSSMNFLHGGKLQFRNLDYKKSIQGDVDYPKMLLKLGRGVIDMQPMPDASMTLAVLSALNPGKTKITGLQTLKAKETDRLSALKTELQKLGAGVRAASDSLAVQGGRFQRSRAIINTYHDHRMAMSFAVAGTLIPGIVIENPDCVNKTYPDFWKDLERVYLAPLKLGSKHLVLTGMRGSGKTHLGQKIARHLRRSFIDTDREIEKDQKMSCAKIVKKYGWDYFRKVEQKICSKVLNSKGRALKPLVIATGGGVVLDPLNMKYLKHNALNIFIFADPTVLAKRISKGKNRPSLTGKRGSAAEIAEVWADRRSLYLRYADRVWDNTSGEIIEKNLGNL